MTKNISNEVFFNKYARPGCIGIVGGTQWADRVVRKAQRPLVENQQDSLWSHVFLFEGKRIDGRHWVLESDLDLHRKHVRFGVQENYLSRYYDEKLYPNVGVLNFHLLPVQIKAILSEGLGLLAARTQYSIRELVGTLISMKKGPLRKRDNLYAQEGAYYCSSFVSHCYGEAGINLMINTSTKNTTPEDIVQSAAKHRAHFLCRQMKFGK